MKSKIKLVVAFLIIAVLIYFTFSGDQYKLLTYLQDAEADLEQFYRHNPVQTIAAYVLFFVISVALFMPLGVPLLLLGGALFGTMYGGLITSIANTIGATLAFIFVRHVFYDDVRIRFKNKLQPIDKAMHRDGIFYLALLRVAPVLPGEMINLLVALTPIRLVPYIWVTFVTRYPINLIYCDIGQDLSEIKKWGDIMSPDMLLSLSALGVFMLGSRLLYMWYDGRKIAKAKSRE